MNIYLTHMDKRLNSTKHAVKPSESLQLDVRLKEPTSEVNPVFIVQRKQGDKAITLYYNYIWQEGWGYYYVDDVVHVTNDIVEIHCHRDVLATGTDYIKNTEAFLTYCSDTSVVDKHIQDDRLGPDVFLYTTIHNATGGFIDANLIQDPVLGTVLLTVVGKDEGSKTYAIPYWDWSFVCQQVVGDNIATVDLLATKFFGENWKACVQGAVYVPIAPSYFTTAWGEDSLTTTIKWGSVEVTTNNAVATTKGAICVDGGTTTVNLSWGTLKDDLAQFRGSKYTSVSFEYPGGSMDISNDAYIFNEDLNIRYSLNLLDGRLACTLYAGNAPIGSAAIDVGWDVMERLASTTSSNEQFIGAASSIIPILPSVAEAALGVATPETMQNITSGIKGAFTGAKMGSPQIASSSTTGIEGYFYKVESSYYVRKSISVKKSVRLPAVLGTNTDTASFAAWHTKYGWPCGKVVKLSSVAVGSYIQAAGASAGNIVEESTHYSLTANEIAQINEFINTGIYLEDLNT